MALKLSCVTKVYGNVFPNMLKGHPHFGNYNMLVLFLIHHFRVSLNLIMKARLSAKSLL